MYVCVCASGGAWERCERVDPREAFQVGGRVGQGSAFCEGALTARRQQNLCLPVSSCNIIAVTVRRAAHGHYRSVSKELQINENTGDMLGV
jgi:hypothetical protein